MRCPRPPREVNAALLERGIIGGLDVSDQIDERHAALRHGDEHPRGDRPPGRRAEGDRRHERRRAARHGLEAQLRPRPAGAHGGHAAATATSRSRRCRRLRCCATTCRCRRCRSRRSSATSRTSACLNYSVDTGFYPLGSCTMKYNPKLHEDLARLPGLRAGAPAAAGRDRPGRAGADVRVAGLPGRDHRHGRGEPGAGRGRSRRADEHPDGQGLPGAVAASRGTQVLVPDSAHGTNLATASTAGFQCLPIASDARRATRTWRRWPQRSTTTWRR